MSNFNYLAIGEHNFKQLVNVVKKLFVDEKREYDLIIGTGNTGLVMTTFTAFILKELHIAVPSILTLPLLRFVDQHEQELFNNDIFLEEVKRQLEGIEKIEQVLFIDDEIYRGISVKTAVQLVMKAKSVKEMHVTVVAEDQGFQWKNDIPGVDLEFLPFAQEIEGHNNVIFYMIPSEYDKPIKDIFPDETLKWHTRINILLGLPIKAIINNKPEFTFRFNKEAKEKIKDLDKLQEDFLIHVKKLIRQSLN